MLSPQQRAQSAIGESMFNLKPTVAIQSKGLLAASLLLASQLSLAQPRTDIPFTADLVYPESAAWSAKQNAFFVTSVHRGVIGKLSKAGSYTPFITDEQLIGTVGIKVDAERNILWVANSDSGASLRSSEATQGKLAALVAYNATTGKRIAYHDLGKLSEGAHFANDIALDRKGNVYVTDSFAPNIYRVNAAGKASIFVTSELFKGEGFNLNGIVYHPKGYLLVSKYNSGELYKIDINNPKQIEKVALPELLSGTDGLLLRSPNSLIAIQNLGIDRTLELVSNDDWKSATIKVVTKSNLPFPTTATQVGKDVYVLNAQLGSLFTPEAEKVSDYLLQKL
jgi:sugar lactone lactonase YvrE